MQSMNEAQDKVFIHKMTNVQLANTYLASYTYPGIQALLKAELDRRGIANPDAVPESSADQQLQQGGNTYVIPRPGDGYCDTCHAVRRAIPHPHISRHFHIHH